MSLRNWFSFQDRNESPYDPTTETMVTVEKTWEYEIGDFDSVDWQKEEWLIKSVLVPNQYLNEVANKVRNPNFLDFDYGWNYKDEFQFGEDLNMGGYYSLYPLVTSFKHPIRKELIVGFNPRFITYHALEKENEHEYYHPLDQLIIAETSIDSHDLYDPTPFAQIHVNYIRDFLAATSMGLLISIVADRFANASTQEELEIQELELEEIDDRTWLTSSIHTPEYTRHGYFRGRSTLTRNILIDPYSKPNFERNPWHYFGDQIEDDSYPPKFIVDDDGRKEILPKNTLLQTYIKEGIGNYGYLYFRSEVLQRFLQTKDYNIYFHMRNWGIASLPGGKGSVDVGINSKGLVTAFGPDIAELSVAEQAYWASHTSIPSGEICEELFQTRMQSNPPHSPSVNELIRDARSKLDSVFEHQFSELVYKSWEPEDQALSKLSVGPIIDDYSEVVELSKTLYGWIIESMQIKPLRRAIESLGGNVNKKLRQIKLLEKILIRKGLTEDSARTFTAPLVGLNELRVGAAHIGTTEIKSSLELMVNNTELPTNPREAWQVCVDVTTESLKSIASELGD